MNHLPELPPNQIKSAAGIAPLDWSGFRSMVYKGAGKYLPLVNDAVLDRLSLELDVIEQRKLLPFFNFWMDIFSFCMENGIITGPGRGTINCSLVAYCLGFTKVNPLDWNLPSVRFLNEISPMVPAFSIDVPMSARDEVIDYLKDSFGKGYVAALSGKPEEDQQSSARLFAPVGSGVVISAQPLLPNVPTLRMPDSKELIVDFPTKHLQNLGCIKLDIHGLRALDQLQRISLMYDTAIYPDDWKDENVIDWLLNASGKDIFPFNSEGIRQLLKDFSPESLDELALVYTLHRPGLIEYVGGMLQFKHGDEDAYFPHESLYAPLSSTYGYIVYKEQFIEIVVGMAGFSYAEADEMCRVLLDDDNTENYTARFMEACAKRGIEEEITQQVMSELIASRPFIFSRAHAIGAVMIGYTLAWHQMNGRI
jgi:DNA polymerase III alpha subunit